MKIPIKLKIYILSLIISLFSCYAVFKMYESIVMTIGERNPEIDNVAGAGLAMVFAPVLLFIFNIIFYLFVYSLSIKRYHDQISSWRILLLNQKSLVLNFIRVSIYLLCLWTFIATLREDVVPIWVILTVTFNIIVYGFWILQMIGERLLYRKGIA